MIDILQFLIEELLKIGKLVLKKNFKSLAREAVPDCISLENVDIWFQDETRIGQQGSQTRIWAANQERVRVL